MSVKLQPVVISLKGGLCDVAYLKKHAITGGRDASLRVVRTDGSSSESKVLIALPNDRAGVNSIATSPQEDLLAVATSDMKVIMYRINYDNEDEPELKFESQMAKFDAAATGVAFGLRGALLVSSSESGQVKLFNVATAEQTADWEAHNACIRALAVDPTGGFLATAAGDGSVRVWSLDFEENETPKMVHEIIGALAKVGTADLDGMSAMLRISWNPEGTHLAVPGSDGKIRCFSKKNEWALDFTLGQDGHSNAAFGSASIFSPNGVYIASTASSEVIVWKCATQMSLFSSKLDSTVCNVRWSPTDNLLACTTQAGSVYLWNNVISDDGVHPAKPFEGDKMPSDFTADFWGDDADFNLESEAAEASEAATAPAQVKPEEEASTTDKMDRGDDDEIELQDDNEDEDAVAFTPMSDVILPPAPSTTLPSEVFHFDEQQYSLSSAQKRFQPSSSSALSSRRVLVWNRVGRVVSVADRMESVVEVEFADVSRFRKMRVGDLYSYTLCGLSEAGVVLAAERNLEAGTHAMVHFKPVAGSRRGSEWQDLLNPEEEVLGVAVGRSWVAAVTGPFGYLRIWLPSGLQQLPIQLPSASLVCAVGDGDMLALLFNAPAGRKLMMFNVARRELTLNCDAPVTPGSELTWAGFTPAGLLVTLDSAGVCRCVVQNGDWPGQWIPLSQPEGSIDVGRKWPLGWPIGATDEALIVIRLSEEEEQITGLVLDEDNRGTPMIDTLRWCVPMVGMNSAAVSGLEGVLRRRMMMDQEESDDVRRLLRVDTEIIKLISLSAKNGYSTRAVDLFLTMKTPRARDVAIRWCESSGYSALGQTLSNISIRLFDEANEASSSSEEDDERHRTPMPGSQQQQQNDAEVFEDEEEEKAPKRKRAGRTKSKTGNPFLKKSRSGGMDRKSSNGFQELLQLV